MSAPSPVTASPVPAPAVIHASYPSYPFSAPVPQTWPAAPSFFPTSSYPATTSFPALTMAAPAPTAFAGTSAAPFVVSSTTPFAFPSYPVSFPVGATVPIATAPIPMAVPTSTAPTLPVVTTSAFALPTGATTFVPTTATTLPATTFPIGAPWPAATTYPATAVPFSAGTYPAFSYGAVSYPGLYNPVLAPTLTPTPVLAGTAAPPAAPTKICPTTGNPCDGDGHCKGSCAERGAAIAAMRAVINEPLVIPPAPATAPPVVVADPVPTKF